MPSKNDRNVVRYRRLSSIYDWGLQRNPLFERPRARLFELADIKSGERVLVVGVGTDDDSFDVVVVSCVLSVVADSRQSLAEAARVLRPSGNIWILGKFCESTPTRARRALSRVLIAVGGASLTRSLTEAIGTTPLRMSHHEHSPAVDIIRLTPR